MSDRPTRQTVVVAGNGMASWRFCHELVESGASEHLRLIVVGQEAVPAYDRVRLTSLLGGTSQEDLILDGTAWYARAGIELYLGEQVTAIDRENCTVTISAGNLLAYDRLVLATGSNPFVPPIPGSEGRGVFVYRTVGDVSAVRRFAAGRETALVIGGGLLGLEAARAVRDLGLRVDIVEAAPGLMPRQLDTVGAALLRAEVEKLGVTVHVGCKPVSITSERGGPRVSLSDGRQLDVDLVVLAAGVRPATEVARAAGLALAPGGGVVVDEGLMTSDDRIFAIGECAAHEGQSYGLVAPAYAMARVLAARFIGAAARFDRQVPPAKLKLLGVDVASVGDYQEREGDAAVLHQRDGRYRKLVLRDGRLAGAVAVGPWPGFDGVADAVQRRQRVWPWTLARFRSRGELGGELALAEWPADGVICACVGVTRRQIEAAHARHPSDVPAICRATTAGTVCRTCVPLIAQLVGARPDLASGSVRPAFAEGSGVVKAAAPLGPMLWPPSQPAADSLVSLIETALEREASTEDATVGAATATVSAAGGVATIPYPVRGFRPPLVTLRPRRDPPRRTAMVPFTPVPGTPPVGLVPTPPALVDRLLPALGILALALLALALLALVLQEPSISLPVAHTLKLVTGWTMVGLTVVTALLSARKRIRFLAVGKLATWRACHAMLAVLSLGVLALHTGITVGENLNRALILTYLAMLALGAVLGLVYAGGAGLEAHRRRRFWLGLHIAAFLPLPLLLALHVLAAYFYG